MPPLAALFTWPTSSDWVEIGILWLVLYAVLRFLRRTIAGGIFRGAGLLVWPVLLGVFLLFHWLQLEVVGVLARTALPVLLVGLIVVFQTELRHGIARLGQSGWVQRLPFFRPRGGRAPAIRAVDEIVQAVFAFRERRVGALIVIERSIDLSTYVDTGVKVDAAVRKELLDALFQRGAVLHDGAVVVRGNRIAAASCYLPLTERPLDLAYGTRHRAAVGLSEVSDALIIVTSEERGQVAVAEGGTLTRFQEPRWLAARLSVVFAERHGLASSEPEAPKPPAAPSKAAPPAGPGPEGGPPAAATPEAGPRPGDPAEPAPAAPSARSSLASEAGLLALSFVLALMTWSLVHDTVVDYEYPPVNVRAQAPPGFRAQAFGPVQLVLRGTRGELREATERLRLARGEVELDVEPLPDNVDERLEFRHGVDVYRLPFPERLLETPGRPPLPPGEVVRLSTRLVRIGRVTVAFKDPKDAEGLRSFTEVQPKSVEVVAPFRALEGDLIPDPVDGDRLRELSGGALGVPHKVTLTFDGWRAGRVGERVGDDVLRRRAGVDLPEVTATVTLALLKEDALTNAVEVFLRSTHEIVEIDALPAERGYFKGELSPARPGQKPDLTFTTNVRTTPDLFEELSGHTDAWRWVLTVPDADLPSDTDKPSSVKGLLTLVVPSGELRQAVVDGYIVAPEVQVSLQVRRR